MCLINNGHDCYMYDINMIIPDTCKRKNTTVCAPGEIVYFCHLDDKRRQLPTNHSFVPQASSLAPQRSDGRQRAAEQAPLKGGTSSIS